MNGVGMKCVKKIFPLVIIVDGKEEEAQCACAKCEKSK